MHKDNSQEESTNKKEKDLQTSLEQLQELLKSGEVNGEVETPSESSQPEDTSISMADLEEAVADIEQFFRNQNTSESE